MITSGNTSKNAVFSRLGETPIFCFLEKWVFFLIVNRTFICCNRREPLTYDFL